MKILFLKKTMELLCWKKLIIKEATWFHAEPLFKITILFLHEISLSQTP